MKCLSLLTLIILTACQHIGYRTPSNEQKPIHFIFTVHGISGNEKTFGDLPLVLKTHLDRLVPAYDHRILNHVYSTGNDHFNTYSFSHMLGKRIKTTLELNPNPLNKISIISHSQGGLISWIWYLKSLEKEEDYAPYYDQAKKVEAFMTLGSPMWGSKLANIANDKGLLKKVKQLAEKLSLSTPLLGIKELQEMAHGSDTIYRFRIKSIIANQNNIDVPARVMPVAGVFPNSNDEKVRNLGVFYRTLLMWGERIAGYNEHHRLESDLAVNLPMARYNFFYSPLKFKGDHLDISDFNIFKNKKYDQLVLVESPHLSWDQKSFYDIAEVPAECLTIKDGKTCTHPSYPYILNFLSNCTSNGNDCNLNEIHNTLFPFIKNDRIIKHTPTQLEPKNLHSFVLDLNFILPNDYDVSLLEKNENNLITGINTVHEKIINPKNLSYSFVLGAKRELKSKVIKITNYKNPETEQIEKHLRITLYGHIVENITNYAPPYSEYTEAVAEGLELPVKIELPNLPIKTANIKIKPTYSSFIEFDYRD